MKNSKTFVRVLVLFAAFAAAPAGVRAQVTTTAPIHIKTKPTKDVLFKGEVLHADSNAITVRSQDNTALVRTFTYSPKVHDKIEQIIARGNYQYGDKVVIRYHPGKDDIALDIHGKPSPPL